jgi:hypothetical protein
MVDTVIFSCSSCQASVQVPSTLAGQIQLCASCGSQVRVPRWAQEPSDVDRSTPVVRFDPFYRPPASAVSPWPARVVMSVKMLMLAGCVGAVGWMGMQAWRAHDTNAAQAATDQGAGSGLHTTSVVEGGSPQTIAQAESSRVAELQREQDALRRELESLRQQVAKTTTQSAAAVVVPVASTTTGTALPASVAPVHPVEPPPTIEHVKDAVKQANGAVFAASSALASTTDELAMVRSRLKITINEQERLRRLSGSDISTADREFMQRRLAQERKDREARLKSLTESVPKLEQAVVEAQERLRTAKTELKAAMP